MNDIQKKLIREFPTTAEGKAFYLFMMEELEKLKDVMTIAGGEVELKARKDAIDYINKILIHFRPSVDKPKNTTYT